MIVCIKIHKEHKRYERAQKRYLCSFIKMGKWMHTQLLILPRTDSKFSVTYCTVFLQNKFHFEHEMYNTGVDRRLPLDMLTCIRIRNCTVLFQSNHLNHYFEYNTLIIKFIWKDKRSWIANTILKNKIGGMISLNLKFTLKL